jgi:CPA2 family monovalent cation:H+ antiporter-2
VCSLRIARRAKIVGQTLGQVELRKKYGITVLAIEREKEIITNPDASTEILSDDIIFVLGRADQIAAIKSLIQT